MKRNDQIEEIEKQDCIGMVEQLMKDKFGNYLGFANFH